MTRDARDVRWLRATLRADYAHPANQRPVQRVLMFIVRVGQHQCGRSGPLHMAWRLADFALLRLLFGAEISPAMRAGPGLALPHAARGVMVAADVVIGAYSMLSPRVVIAPVIAGEVAPQLADNVFVGPGACIIGPVKIGSHAHIGPNAVVLHDVPAGASVFSPCARVIRAD